MSLKKIFNCVAAIGLLSFAVHAAAVSVGEGDWDFCSAQNRCNEGQGDCDFDYECKAGLKCTKDVGPSYGFDKGVDVCTSSSSSSSTSSTSSTSSSTSSGNFGGGVSSSSSSSTSTSSTSSGTNPLDPLLSSSSSSTSSGTTSSSSGGGCQLNPGTLTYCAVCGPCSEGQSVCHKDSECATGLVCSSNGFCVKP